MDRFVSPEDLKRAMKNGIILEAKGMSPVSFILAQENRPEEFDLRPASPKRERLINFAIEYEALCRKYGLQIDACGCCNSPWLVAIDEDNSDFEVLLRDIDYSSIVTTVSKYIEEQNI